MALKDRINSKISQIRRSGNLPERRILYFHSQIDDIIDWAITNSEQLRSLLRSLPHMGLARAAGAKRLKDEGLLCDLRRFYPDARTADEQPPCMYITDFHIHARHDEYISMIEHFLTQCPSSVLLISSPDVLIPRGFEDRVELIEAIQIDQDDVVELLLNALQQENPLCGLTEQDVRLQSLARRFKGLSSRQIKDILYLVKARCDVVCELSPACIDNEALRTLCHDVTDQHIRQVKAEIGRKDGALIYIDVDDHTVAVGMDVYETWLRQRAEDFKKGHPNAPRAVTFVGVPGTGKTLMAIRTARLLDCELVRFNLSMIKTRDFGGSSTNLRAKLSLFDAQSPLVVLIDEVEKDLPESGGRQTHEVTASLLGTLLSWMSDRKAPVFLFLTSNDITRINSELFRPGRVDRIFFVGMPWRDELAAILQANLISRQKDWKAFRKDFLPAKLIAEMEACQEAQPTQTHECCVRIVDALAELIEKTGRDIFFTGADLGQLINDAISHLRYTDGLSMPFTPDDLQRAMCILTEASHRSTGERKARSIAALYLQCASEQYDPASSRNALVDVARTGKLSEQRFDNVYDRQLYRRIGSMILDAMK